MKNDRLYKILYASLIVFHLFFLAGEAVFGILLMRVEGFDTLMRMTSADYLRWIFPARLILSYLDLSPYGYAAVIYDAIGTLRWVCVMFTALFGIVSALEKDLAAYRKMRWLPVKEFTLCIAGVSVLGLLSRSIAVEMILRMIRIIGGGFLLSALGMGIGLIGLIRDYFRAP